MFRKGWFSKEGRSRKVILLLLFSSLSLSLLQCEYIGRYFQQKYFRDEYKPQELEVQVIGSFPSECHLEAIPWISYEKGYCQTAALQMIAYKHGLKPSLGYLNFLMGFTYGAVHFGNLNSFMAYTDPEPGSRVAAPYLGLERRYIVTNDPDAFLKALRFYLSKGYPVRIALNSFRLRGKEGFSPHSELLVGYDESGFYYFETGGEDRFVERAEGLKLTDQTLIEAVGDLCEKFNLPWEFALTIFEKREKEEDLSEIWGRNGELLVGSKWGPIAQGSVAIKEFASNIEKVGLEIKDWRLTICKLKAASYTRLDNAKFLKGYFAGDEQVEKAAELLKEAGGYYKEALKVVGEGVESKANVEKVVALLRKAASEEEEAGKIFINKGEARPLPKAI